MLPQSEKVVKYFLHVLVFDSIISPVIGYKFDILDALRSIYLSVATCHLRLCHQHKGNRNKVPESAPFNAPKLVQTSNCIVLVWIDATASNPRVNPGVQHAVCEHEKDQNKFVFIWKFNGERANVAELPIAISIFKARVWNLRIAVSTIWSFRTATTGLRVSAHGQAPNAKPTFRTY